MHCTKRPSERMGYIFYTTMQCTEQLHYIDPENLCDNPERFRDLAEVELTSRHNLHGRSSHFICYE
jgi:hypothetical protein